MLGEQRTRNMVVNACGNTLCANLYFLAFLLEAWHASMTKAR